MAKTPKPQTAMDAVLAPLAALARDLPDLEGQVLWHRDGGWSDGAGDLLEAEEITYYAEGLLLEGFSLMWDHLHNPTSDDNLVRMCFWQGDAPDPPAATTGWQVLGHHRVTPPQ